MSKYFSFDGIATRSEYWAVMILSYFVSFMLYLIAVAMMLASPAIGMAMIAIVVVAQVWLQLSTMVRRWNDAGVNPWWTLAIFVPYVNIVTFIVAGCLSSKE